MSAQRQPSCQSFCRSSPSFFDSHVFRSSLRLFIVLVFFVQLSWQQKDPISDFCRRFGHQTAVIDRKLIIDGGFVNWNPLSQNPANYTNSWLLYEDLTTTKTGMPPLYANLSKNATIPSVSGGILWADTVNKRAYLYGGEYTANTPDTYKLLAYDSINNEWDSFGLPTTPINRLSWGAGTSVSERGEGYYYGGWLSNASVPNWNGGRIATANMIKYNMDSNVWTNYTGPDAVPRAEGVMVYLPASDRGMLVYFGGVSAPYGNDSVEGLPMSTILVYDIGGAKWYNQTASGDVPDMRRRFCAGATWAQDQSSYNIYLYGGAGITAGTAFDDVYILSIPSFTWIKWYPTAPGPGSPHGSLSCNVIDGAQMLIIGGTFPQSDACDAPDVYGTHNLDLGKQNSDKAQWHEFQTNLTTYVVPPEIISKIGGSGQGGATVTSPAAGWGNRDLPVLMTRKASVAVRTATRSIPTASVTPSPSPSGPVLSTGAIAGIAVGGAVFVIAILCCCCLFVRRRHRRKVDVTIPYQHPQTAQAYIPSQEYPHHQVFHPASPVELSSQPLYAQGSPPAQYAHHPVQEVNEQPKYDDTQNSLRSRSTQEYGMYAEQRPPYPSPTASAYSGRSPASDGWVEMGGSRPAYHQRQSPLPEYASLRTQGSPESPGTPPRRPVAPSR